MSWIFAYAAYTTVQTNTMPLSSLHPQVRKHQHALFEKDPDVLQSSTMPSAKDSVEDETLLFPTLPAFLCPVEIRVTPSFGADHKGVFALVDIPSDTKFWKWTNRVHQIRKDELHSYIQQNIIIDEGDHHQQSSDDGPAISPIEASSSNNREAIRIFLRQGFVLPNEGSVRIPPMPVVS